LDWYEDYPTDPVTDPKGPASASDRVMRGGSLMFHARYCRSACRGYDIPDCKTYVLGFRLALSNVQ
jgi:formylglycine-generating enzyme required for sulfatase activity